MRVRKVKRRHVRESEKSNTLFSWQNGFSTHTRLSVAFLGAVLPESGWETPRNFMKHPG